jgi:ribosome recycling factor
MTTQKILAAAEERMKKALESVRHELSGVRRRTARWCRSRKLDR